MSKQATSRRTGTRSGTRAKNVPGKDGWPGGFGIYKYSKEAVKLNLEPMIVLWLATVALDVLTNVAFRQNPVAELIFGIFLAPLTAATALTVIAGVRGKRLPLGESLNKAWSLWLRMIWLLILLGLALFVSMLLLVIPFFFVLPRVVLSHYFLVDMDLKATEAIKASWETTAENVGKVYGVIGVNILMALLMITIIGIPFAIYLLFMFGAAYAVLYEYLSKQR